MATQLSLGLAPAHVRLDAFHRDMALLRAVDDASRHLDGGAPSCLGLEAALAGTCVALSEKDWVLPGPRQASIALLRGASLVAWFAQLLGRSADPARGRQAPGHASFRSLHVVSPTSLPGSQLPIAAGVARAMKLARRGEVALAACGHGAVATDRFHVGLNFAAVAKSPVVFVVLTQGELARVTASRNVAVKASAYGMQAFEADGGDPLAVEAAVRAAVESARAGQGPSLVDVRCPVPPALQPPKALRVVGASTSDDAWAEADPLARVERLLAQKGPLDAAGLSARHDDARRRVAEAVAVAMELPAPEPSLLFDDVFARMTAALRSQRRDWLADRAFAELED